MSEIILLLIYELFCYSIKAIKIADMVLASTQEDINTEREDELRLLQGGYLEGTLF